ncbi:hypothetical protein C5F59_020280 [Streptomyces sp. QL37]|uniref:hypothetical protein n=1 Tax=Streptomyces sp. QL37 TaxID=2093747 RepID=UPI000CF2644D|nr:hypothetical protein [Streptomyces sp. QL37]PPQ58395.1 hypothetical protein C5F59_18240 [Streptomyces sp. QL37]
METVLLQNYVRVRVRGGRTAILGPGPGGADDLVASVLPARAAPALTVATVRALPAVPGAADRLEDTGAAARTATVGQEP